MLDISPTEHPLLYRAIKSRSWFAQTSAAFLLRQNELGISVIFSANCTKTVCDAGQNKCFGELVLETLAVITYGWGVNKDDPNHGEILGLPPYESELRIREDAASDLAELVTDIKYRPS